MLQTQIEISAMLDKSKCLKSGQERLVVIGVCNKGYGLYSKRVFTSDGIKEAVVIIKGEKIADIIAPELAHPDYQIEDLHDLCLLPGLVDSHTCLSDKSQDAEGFKIVTRAAASGGITTIASMPDSCNPPATTAKTLQAKLDLMSGSLENNLWIDCAFFGGVVPGNESELERMIGMGVSGFMCFLSDRATKNFPGVSEEDLLQAMPILAEKKIPLIVHAGLGAEYEVTGSAEKQPYKDYLASHPARTEIDGVQLLVRLCREHQCHVHVANLSAWESLHYLSLAKRDGLPITAETCPHYLVLEAEKIPEEASFYKCSPPIRDADNREKLWRGLTAGIIDLVGTNQFPGSLNMTQAHADKPPITAGASCMQFALPLMWTEARKRGLNLSDLVEWMCMRPARFLGLSDHKGAIKVGCDADIIAFDPDAEQQVEWPVSQEGDEYMPYQGRRLTGQVRRTYLRGRIIYEEGKWTAYASGNQLPQVRAGVKFD